MVGQKYRERGAIFVELAITLSLLWIPIFVMGIDSAIAFYDYNLRLKAARNGAREAARQSVIAAASAVPGVAQQSAKDYLLKVRRTTDTYRINVTGFTIPVDESLALPAVRVTVSRPEPPFSIVSSRFYHWCAESIYVLDSKSPISVSDEIHADADC